MNLTVIREVFMNDFLENLKRKAQVLALPAGWNIERCAIFPRTYKPTQNCRRQKGDMNQASY
jgi:hypothetical protein